LHWIWDEEKSRTNRRDHEVSFETAQLVFDDPLAITLPDPFPGEERWRTVGSPSNSIDVILLDETGEEIGRIISARKATRNERRAYEEGAF